MYILVVKQLITMILILAGGFIFAKATNVQQTERKFLSRLLIYFINPCLVFNSFNVAFDSHRLIGLLFVAALALVVHIVMILIGFISSKEQIDRLAVVFTNCGFVGIPLINGVFGSEGVFYLMGYLIVFNILLWTYGYYLMSGNTNIIKILINPNILSVLLGLLVFCSPITVPAVISRPVELIGETNTAIAMILLGVLLSEFKASEISAYLGRLAKVCFLRMIVVSLVNILILYAASKIFVSFENIKMMLFVVLICSLCPCATSIPTMACLFDRDTKFSSLIVSVTSLLTMISIPAFVALAESIIK